MNTVALLNEDQKNGLEILNNYRNVFLSGAAGTGKSFLLNAYLEQAREEKNIIRLASTGIAALLIDGVTFNSFFGLGIMKDNDEKILAKAKSSYWIGSNFDRVDEIVIDEVSMISGRAMRLAEKIARYHGDQSQPWGGIRIIACGDFFQLPPIAKTYDNKIDFCFKTTAWDFTPVFLRQKMRCKDPEYNQILNYIRNENNRRTWEVVKAFLSQRKVEPPSQVPFLHARKKNVSEYNYNELKLLPGIINKKEVEFSSDDPMVIKKMENSLNCDSPLLLKEGALVMTTINCPQEGYYNGSIGIVEEIDPYFIHVKLKCGKIVTVGRIEKRIHNSKMETIGTVTFFPLKLAWALTIHKSQGQSFEEAEMSLKQLWEAGQGYVALSRLKSSDGLYLKHFDKTVMLVNSEVKKFYDEGCPPATLL